MWKHERTDRIHFSALQSDFASRFLKEKGIDNLDLSTFYFWDGKFLTARSTAALKLAGFMKFPARLIQVFWIIPRFLRDGVYRFIARNRKRLMGSFCVLPTPEQRKRFLE